MSDISQITLPSGTTYQIKDAYARAQISAVTGGTAVVFKGVSTRELIDNGTQKPLVDGVEITELVTGDIYFYGTREFIWGPNPNYPNSSANEYIWHELGNLTGLGGLAYKSSASTVYQPTGTFNSINFTGNPMTMSTDYTPSGRVTVSATSFAEQKYAVSTVDSGGGVYKPEGTVTSPTFQGTATTITMNTDYTPEGEVTSVPITLSTSGTTTFINNPIARIIASEVTTAAPGDTTPANNLTYYAVQDETLSLYQIGYNTTASIETSSVEVKTGDATYRMSGMPTFNGTTTTISTSTNYIPAGINTEPTFAGKPVQLATSTVSVPSSFEGSFIGGPTTITVSGTPSGNITQPIFTGTTTTITVS